ncbi:phosphoribosylformylglycinamidine cyclo-ligase [Jatrophihabitans sp. YIM 134969]
MSETPGLSYAGSGVDVAAGERAVELMKGAVARTRRPELLGGIGGFAGLFSLDVAKYRQPVLAAATDGVGTKIAIARAMDRHDTIGIDLVAMVVDDIVVCGAEPLFMTDYVAVGRVVPEKVATIVGGIAEGCVQAGCTLIGGETAEHPGLMEPDEYDLSGSGVGVVEADAVLGSDRVAEGDVLIAMASSGLHANGYSLVRRALFSDGMLDTTPPQLDGRTLGDELLTPTRIYTKDCLALIEAFGADGVHAFCHVTGGGLAANLARVLPAGVDAEVDRSTWTPGGVFRLVAEAGPVARDDLEIALNLGVGMIAVVSAARAGDTLDLLRGRGVAAWRLGAVVPGSGQTRMLGEYAR